MVPQVTGGELVNRLGTVPEPSQSIAKLASKVPEQALRNCPDVLHERRLQEDRKQGLIKVI